MSDITQNISSLSGDAPDKDTQTPEEFSENADNFAQKIAEDWPTELNTFASQANSLKVDVNTLKSDTETARDAAQSAKNTAQDYRDEAEQFKDTAISAVASSDTAATSSTNLTIGTGTKSLTVETGKDFVIGMYVIVAYTSGPANYMAGTITSYNSGTGALEVDVTRISGSGTQSDWIVSLSGIPGVSGSAAGATTKLNQSADISLTSSDDQAQSISFDGAGYSVTLPDATGLSSGLPFILMNEGDYDYGVRDNGGNLINVVQADTAVYCYLISNGTSNGTWRFDPVTLNYVLPGDLTAFNSTISLRNCLINLDDSVLISVYRDYDNSSYGTAIALDASDGSVLDGPLVFDTDSSDYFSGDRLSNTEAFFGYNATPSLGEHVFKVIIISYNDGSLSIKGGPKEIITERVDSRHGCCALSSTEIGICFADDVNKDLRAIVVGWDGVDITFLHGPIQIDSNEQDNIECIAINTSNWICFSEDAATDDLFGYSINWNGVDNISLNETKVEIVDGTWVDGTPQIIELEDDGTYIWYAVVFELNNGQAYISISKLTKADNTIASSIAVSTVNPTGGVTFNRYCIQIFGNLLYIFGTVNLNNNLCVSIFEWDSNDPSLAEITYQELTTHTLEMLSACKISTNQVMLVGGDTDNNRYGTALPMEVIA